MTFEQREKAIGMLTAGMSARDVARHFQRLESTISRLLNRFQQTGNVTDRPDQANHVKQRRGKTVFSRLRLDAIDFLSSRKIGRLLRNATGKRVCDRTIRNRLHAARLKACRPYVGIPLT